MSAKLSLNPFTSLTQISEPLTDATDVSRPGRLLLILLILVLSLGETATQLMLPILPEAAQFFGTQASGMQITLTLYVAMLGLGQLIAGPLSDRWGRKPVLLLGLTLYVLGGLGAYLSGSLESLVWARMLQGLGASAGVVLARAMTRDLWGKEAGSVLALSLFGMMMILMGAPLLGGLLAGWAGWRSVFALSAGLGLLALGGIISLYRESLPLTLRRPSGLAALLKSYRELLQNRRFSAFLAALGLTYGVLFVFISGSAFVLIGSYGVSRVQYGYVSSSVLLGLVFGTLLASRFVKAWGPLRLVRFGTGLVLSGVSVSLLGALSSSLPLVLLPQLLVTLGAGLVLPAAVAGGVMPFPERAGLASGLLGAAQMGLAMLFGLLLGFLQDGSAQSWLWVQLLAAVSAFGVFRALMPLEPVVELSELVTIEHSTPS